MNFLSRLSAAERGERKFNKAILYDTDNSSEEDMQKAVALYRSAVKNGNVSAMSKLAWIYQHGVKGVEKDVKRAIELLERAIALEEDTYALDTLALLYLDEDDGKESARSKELFTRSIDLGRDYSRTYLGTLLFQGAKGVQRDVQHGQQLFETNVDKAFLYNMFSYVFMLVCDETIRDPMRALQVAEKVLYEGPESSTHDKATWVADLLFYGDDGVQPDKRKALEVYEQSLEADDDDIVVDYGVLFQFGDKELGIPKDETRAKQIFQRCVDENAYFGKFFALFHFGFLYELGSPPVPQDMDKARQYYSQAAFMARNELYRNFAYVVDHKSNDMLDEDIWTVKHFEEIADVLKHSGRYSFVYGLCFEHCPEYFPTNEHLSLLFYENAARKGNTCGKVKAHQRVLEKAWMAALVQPEIVDDEYIRTHIRAEYVTTAAAFVCGHNLLLLALRKRIISETNLQEFQGNALYFRENLYSPATQLVSGNEKVIYPIWKHAERLGFIADACVYVMVHGVRVDMNRSLVTIHSILDNLSSQLTKQADNVRCLATYLSQLEEGMRHQARNDLYATVAKCALSLIPLVGGSLGDIVDFGIHVGIEIAHDDVVGFAIEMANVTIDEVASVDLSNLEVIERVFSDDGLSKLDESARACVVSSVEQSSFKQVSSLQEMLKLEIQNCKKENATLHKMNTLSSPFDNVESSAGSRSSAPAAPVTTISGDDSLNRQTSVSIDVAVERLNRLQIRDGLQPVSADEFEDLFLQCSAENEITVSESVFDAILQLVRKDEAEEELKKKRLEQIESKCRSYFKESTKRSGILRCRVATRAVKLFLKKMGDEGLLDSSVMDGVACEDIKSCVVETDDGDEKIDEEEFTQVVMSLVTKGMKFEVISSG